MKLILLRHAKSDWTGGVDDHDRPLNERGLAAAPRIGGWLRQSGHVPTRILCSSARRTRQTLAGLDLGEVETEYLDRLYNAEAEVILQLARENAVGGDGAGLMIVAHNPGITEAAARAVRRPPTHPEFARFPTGSCLVTDIADGLPGTALDYVVPRDLD